MQFRLNDTTCFKITKYKTMEISSTTWNPLNNVDFDITLNIHFKGDHSPSIFFNLSLFFISFNINIYDNRHEKDN